MLRVNRVCASSQPPGGISGPTSAGAAINKQPASAVTNDVNWQMLRKCMIGNVP